MRCDAMRCDRSTGIEEGQTHNRSNRKGSPDEVVKRGSPEPLVKIEFLDEDVCVLFPRAGKNRNGGGGGKNEIEKPMMENW